MGVIKKEWNGDDAEVDEMSDTAKTMCAVKACASNIIVMDLTSEDEEIVQYDGACSTCGLQYHMVIDKDNHD